MDQLKTCLESVKKYTDKDFEVIVVANGAPPEVQKYVESFGPSYGCMYYPEMLGYPKAINVGIQAARGDYFILLNDDAVLLEQPKNCWVDMLLAPFKDPTMGITGPILGGFIVFFCACISRAVVDKVGYLDEDFGLGAGEDADYCIRARKMGFLLAQVPQDGTLPSKAGLCIGSFPIYHKGEATVHDSKYVKNWVEHCNKNCDLLDKKHPDQKLWHRHDLKLNLGCGPKNHHLAGYTNIDLVDPDADINCDARNLSQFKDGSCTEVVASHLVEHFNPYELPKIFKEWYRVLKPGGKLILELPDIYECCKEIAKRIDEKTGDEWIWLACVYGAFPDRSEMQHLYGWHIGTLTPLLVGAGFKNVVKLPQQWWHQGSNMRVEAYK